MAGIFTRKRAMREIAAVNAALRAGHPIKGVPGCNTVISAASRAAIVLQQSRKAFTDRIGTPTRPGTWKRKFALEPDWSLEKKPEDQTEATEDELDRDRKRIEQRDLVGEAKRLREALIEMQDIRAGVLKLVTPPLRPQIDAVPLPSGKGERTVIIHLSDWHCGEHVSIDEMDGLNSYSLDIFKKRVGRLGAIAKSLMTTHWKGDAPERIIVILGGDQISGEIHEELAKTNEALATPAVKICAIALAGLLKLLRTIAPVDVYDVPGNHGRLTKKPESKGMAVNSFDTLIAHVCEMILSSEKGIRFFHSTSGDILLRVYGITIAVVHGDRIGSRGGQGFIGPIATILRGVHKTRSYFAGQGIMVDYVMIGHYHTTSKLPRAFSNGSLVGPSEYSRDLRADPEPAKQNFIVVHSERGVIDWRELYCGAPDEGSIYRARGA
jgi:hypothetical protein